MSVRKQNLLICKRNKITSELLKQWKQSECYSPSSLKAQDAQVPLGIDAGETENDHKCHFIIPSYDFLIYA